jgi:hypothetical protein
MVDEPLTKQPDLHLSNKSKHQLSSLYDQHIIRLNTFKADEEDSLRRARERLKEQAEDHVNREDVFGGVGARLVTTYTAATKGCARRNGEWTSCWL